MILIKQGYEVEIDLLFVSLGRQLEQNWYLEEAAVHLYKRGGGVVSLDGT